MKPTVHVLHYGRALCGSVHGEPQRWGAAHRWVGYDFTYRGGWKGWATCLECRIAAALLDEMGKGELQA